MQAIVFKANMYRSSTIMEILFTCQRKNSVWLINLFD